FPIRYSVVVRIRRFGCHPGAGERVAMANEPIGGCAMRQGRIDDIHKAARIFNYETLSAGIGINRIIDIEHTEGIAGINDVLELESDQSPKCGKGYTGPDVRRIGAAQ